VTPWPHRHYCTGQFCAVCVADLAAQRDESVRQLAVAAGVPDLVTDVEVAA
jgi:hypothetical protein